MGCRSVFRLGFLRLTTGSSYGYLFSTTHQCESSLTGAAHFVFDALPVCVRSFACLHVEARQLPELHGRRFSFLTTGLLGRRGVTSGCVKSGGTLESLSLRVCCCDELKVALLIFAVNSSAAIFGMAQKNRSVAGLVVAQKGIFRFKLCGRAPRKLND